MIKLSQTWDDALKAVCYVADKGGLVQIRDIALHEGMSETCLRRIIADLNTGGILETKQGRNGGVQLAKSPNQISVFDIFLAVGEEMGITDCTKWSFCEKQDDCYTTDVLWNLQKGFNSLLKMNTLDKIIKK